MKRVPSKISFFLGLLVLPALLACDCEDLDIRPTLADLDAWPDPVEFGEVPVSTTRTVKVTLTNRGTYAVVLHGLSVPDDEKDFSGSVPEEIEYPHSIAPGNQVVFTVRYHPQDYPEQDEGAVLIESTDKDAPEYDLMCYGTAIEPILLVQPVPVDFGSTRVMGTKPATLTIEHTGSDPDPVTVSLIEVTDDADGDFAIQHSPDVPFTLNPDDKVNVNLSYIPQAIDDGDEGLLTIESDAESQERIDVPLLGSSYAPHIVVSTTALSYGTVSQGADPTLSFTISNEGNADLNVSGMELSQVGSQKFDLDPPAIDQPIAPWDTVEVRVTYIADDRGDDDGTLRIDHDDPLERPVFIQLHGRTPAPDVEIVPDFVTINISGASHTQTVDIRIYNLGDEDLRVFGMEFDNPYGSFSIDAQPPYPAIVAPGVEPAGPFETVTVRFTKDTPTVVDQATLTFTTDDPDEETLMVVVNGTYSP